MSTITTKNAVFNILVLLLLATSCKKQEEPPIEVFLEKGLENAKEHKYESCIFSLEKIDDIAPYSSYSKTATPVLIYCHYMQANYENIQSMIENFESVHPSSNQLPYLYYLRGLSDFRTIRNYKKSLKKINDILLTIKRLNEIAPESKYAENLNKLLPFLLKLQDKHTMYVAQNYTKTQNFIAAAHRYSNLYETTLNSETKKMIANSMNSVLKNLGID